MDPISTVSIVANIIAIFDKSSNLYRGTRQLASRQQLQLLARNHGPLVAYIVAWLSPRTAQQYESIHLHILRGSNQEAMNFRQAITNECNMTAIAVSLASKLTP